MMTLSQEEKGLPQKISDDIIALILEENLKPGDKLPNETILSQRLDVGLSILFNRNASSGGLDIVAEIMYRSVGSHRQVRRGCPASYINDR